MKLKVASEEVVKGCLLLQLPMPDQFRSFSAVETEW
jgi:hypothetical protein